MSPKELSPETPPPPSTSPPRQPETMNPAATRAAIILCLSIIAITIACRLPQPVAPVAVAAPPIIIQQETPTPFQPETQTLAVLNEPAIPLFTPEPTLNHELVEATARAELDAQIAISNESIQTRQESFIPGIAWPQEFPAEAVLKHIEEPTWWYAHGINSSLECIDDPQITCIPITRCALISELGGLFSNHNGFILVGNESNLDPEFEDQGCHMSPEEAARRTIIIQEAFPNAEIVAGNPSSWSIGFEYDSWLPRYAEALGPNHQPYAYGGHAYVEGWITPSHISKWITDFTTAYPGPEFWVTEAGVETGDIATEEQLLEVLDKIPAVTRLAMYTTKQITTLPDGTPAGWAIYGDNLDHVDANGNLTTVGRTYVNYANDH